MRSGSPAYAVWVGTLIAIIAFGLFSAYLRFTEGFDVTALNDYYPWGLWIFYDVLAGIAISAGGFTLAFMIYLLGERKYEPLLRPTLLTCLLGYLATAIGLLIDINQPPRFWHPLYIPFMNERSVLLEVYLCIVLYIIIQLLEFSPVVFEGAMERAPRLSGTLGISTLYRVIKKLTIPLAIIGIIVPTLHQSSLGGLFLIAPTKLHPLWYSSMLPLLFYISALAAAPAMIIIESNITSRTMGRGLERELLETLAKWLLVLALFYFLLRVGELATTGELQALANPADPRVSAFYVEVLAGFLIPAILMVPSTLRGNAGTQFLASILLVFGVFLNRFNQVITAWLYPPPGMTYIPTWTEIGVTAMVMAFEALVFTLAVKYLPVFPKLER